MAEANDSECGMIERLPVMEIRPSWEDPKGNRYVSHPALRMAIIQVTDDPEYIYVVTEQMLPTSTDGAVTMVTKWKEANATADE